MKNFYALLCAVLIAAAAHSQTSWKGTTSSRRLGITAPASDAVSSFSPFTLGSLSGSNPLPIQLLYFTAALNGEQVDLDWATAVEINNDRFEVQRTMDGVNFETIATIEGAGTSSQQHTYAATDAHPLSGTSYYRLKQIDENGHATYSELEMITYEPKLTETVTAFPNPGNGSGLTVNVPALTDENIVITVYGTDGKVCHRTSTVAAYDGMNAVRLDFPLTLQAGLYFVDVTVSSENKTETFEPVKIIVQ